MPRSSRVFFAASIFEELPENWINIRYGGDEFISIGSCSDEVFIKDVITRLNNNLEKKVDELIALKNRLIAGGVILSAIFGFVWDWFKNIFGK